MKKTICLLLAALLLLSGCQASVSETTEPAETTVAPTETTVPETTEAETAPDVTVGLPGEIAFANPGKIRIQYSPTGASGFVRYITSVDQLPDEEALEGYDAEFFENHALLLVVETVNSGSVQLEIESIRLEGDTASVSLKRTMSGDFGTTDMATWLLWAEVEKDLAYEWVLENASKLPEVSKY